MKESNFYFISNWRKILQQFRKTGNKIGLVKSKVKGILKYSNTVEHVNN